MYRFARAVVLPFAVMLMACGDLSEPSVETASGAVLAADPGSYKQVLASAVAGDTVQLKAGQYGVLSVRGLIGDASARITIKGGPGIQATQIDVLDSAYVTVSAIEVFPPAIGTGWASLVQARSTTTGIVFDHLQVRGGPAKDYLRWSLADWQATNARGVTLEGHSNKIQDSRVLGVRTGIFLLGKGCSALRNTVEGLHGDAFAVQGPGHVLRGNRIFNFIDRLDGNHRDCFQGRDPGAPNVVIDANVCVHWTGPSNHPFVIPDHTNTQGVMLHESGWQSDNATITNNQFVISAYWGIYLNASPGSVIRGNTVVSADLATVAKIRTTYTSNPPTTASERTVIDDNKAQMLIPAAADAFDAATNSVIGPDQVQPTIAQIIAALASPPADNTSTEPTDNTSTEPTDAASSAGDALSFDFASPPAVVSLAGDAKVSAGTLALDGAGDFATFASKQSWAGATSITAVVRFRFGDPDRLGYARPLHNDQLLEVNVGGTALNVGIVTTSGKVSHYIDGLGLDDLAWHTLEVSIDTTANRYLLRVDGKPLIDRSDLALAPIPSSFGSSVWYLGGMPWGRYLSGEIDSVTVTAR